jgi:hypothetical protein
MSRLLQLFRGVVLLAAMGGASVGSGRAFAEQAVLLGSTVPGYQPGMVLASTDRLNVPDGATATLLFQSGEIMHLRGPFEGTLAQQQGGSGGVATLADMLRAHGVDAAVIGGTRSLGSARSAFETDDILIDPQHSATYCLEPATSVWIARPSGDAGPYALRRRGTNRAIAWPSDATRIEWPADVPIDDGAQFEIVTNATDRATVTFRMMSTPSTSMQAKVAEGMILGCRDQFDGPLRLIRRLTVSPALWITTDHGRQPIYRKGDPVVLTVMADVDGYLYCVADQTGGGTTPIFPAGAVDGAQLRGSIPLSIPGRRQPGEFTAQPGLTQIRCWLADRDVSGELPHALLGTPAQRLPDQLASQLDDVFAQIAGSHVATDALKVVTNE